MKPQIGIIGYAGPEEYPKNNGIDPKCYRYAYEIGHSAGKMGWSIITGGKSGIMESASKGCKEGKGISVGVISGNQRFKGNEYLDIEVCSNSSPGGGAGILIAMCDIVVMIGGGAGTLEEIAIAYRMGKPIIIVKNTGGWSDKILDNYLDTRRVTRITKTENVKETIEEIRKILQRKKICQT